MTERLPANVEAEAAFLGAVLIKNDTLDGLPVDIAPVHFSVGAHQAIFSRIIELRKGGATVTPVTLRPYFETDEGLKALGGLPYLARLTADAQGLLAPRELAEQIHELAQRRNLIAAAQDLIAAAQDTTEATAPTELAAQAVNAISDLATRRDMLADYPLHTLAELSALPAPSWLIRGLIGTTSFGTIYGAPKSLKSFIAIDAGLHIAHGMEWHGKHVRQTGVLYICGEGASGIQRRIDGWLIHHGIQDRNAPFIVLPVAVHLLKPANVQRLKRAIDQAQRRGNCPIGLVIIDTVSRSIPGADENATDTMTAFIAACDEIRAHAGAAVLGVHHSGKDKAKGLRGNSSLLGAVDFAMRADRSGDILTLTMEAQKDAEEVEPIQFTMETIEWDSGNTDTPGEAHSTLVPVLAADQTPTAGKGPAANLTGHKATALKALTALIDREGEPLPGNIPPDVLDRSKVTRGITSGQAADKLASEFFAVVSAAEDKRADTAARTARRAIGGLKAAQILETWGDWLWIY